MSENRPQCNIELQERSDATIVRIHHPRYYITEQDCELFRRTLSSLIERRIRKIYLDLQNLGGFGGSFCGPIITTWRRALEMGGRFVLARITPIAMEYMEIIRFTQVFDIRADLPPEKVVFPSSEERGFIQGIREAGDDPSVSLIFSDWLEERDDDRAELIRLQCERESTRDPERVKEMVAREEELLSKHERRWVGSLAGIARDWKWRRGSIHQVTLSTSALEDHIDDLFKLAPIRQLSICGGYQFPQFRQDRWMEMLKRTESVNELSELVIQTRNLTDQEVEPLLESEWLSGLTRLDLSHQSHLSAKTIRRFRRKFGTAFKKD